MDDPTVQPIKVVSAGKEIEAEIRLWDEAPDNRDQVKLQLRFDDIDLQVSAENYFRALIDLRLKLEAIDATLYCYGACKDVYPSPMIESMGVAERAFRLTLGKHSSLSDLVPIFDSEPGLPIASVREQSLFYERWLRTPRE